MALLRSLRSAAAFVDRAGIALVFPSADLALPSLWEAATGTREVTVFSEHEGQRALTPELEHVWQLKDGLAAESLACVGKHVRNRLAAVSLDLLPSLYALTGRAGRPDDFRESGLLSPLERDLAEALLEAGPQTGPALRRLLGLRDAAKPKRALESLQRLLVVTQAGEADQEQGWAAAVFDITARRYRDPLRRLPGRDDANAAVAGAVLRAAGELSAADLGAILGVRRREAADILSQLENEGRARRRDDSAVALWSPD